MRQLHDGAEAENLDVIRSRFLEHAVVGQLADVSCCPRFADVGNSVALLLHPRGPLLQHGQLRQKRQRLGEG